MAVTNGPDLSFSIGNSFFRNPVFSASGTFGYGKEFENFVNLRRLGAIIVKGISLEPRKKIATPPPSAFKGFRSLRSPR